MTIRLVSTIDDVLELVLQPPAAQPAVAGAGHEAPGVHGTVQ